MDPLEIKKYPDDILRKECADIEEVGAGEAGLFEEMLFTMRHYEGIGLAAPQIGISKNMIVADIGNGAVRLANPKVLRANGIYKMGEGCLSLPGITVEVERPYELVAGGLNENNRFIEIKTKGLLARVIQHEIDHLKGKLIIDYLNLFGKFKLRIQKRQVERYADL